MEDHHLHHSHQHTMTERGQRKGRRLIDAVRLLGPHEEAATYWELFSDLLMVAAASSLAEVLEEEADVWWVGSRLWPVVHYNCEWMALVHTHHYTASILIDSTSLAPFLYYYSFYYLGMAGSIDSQMQIF